MKTIQIRQIRKFGLLLVGFFLSLLAAEEITAQFIENQNARMDVRGTSRRTARRVNRRHDRWQAPAETYVVAPAPAAAAAAGAATAAVLLSLPAGCSEIDGLYNCNGIRYQAQMQGTEVVYVQVN